MEPKEEITPIKTGFTSKKGIYYEHVREIPCQKNLSNLGTYITSSRKDNDSDFSDYELGDSGVYIYQDSINPNVGYRIYKSYNQFNFYSYEDAELINKLLQRQEQIKLTKFPTGVVTLNNRVVGQEMPFFPNEITLFELFKSNKSIKPVKIYITVLKILKELYINGIAYIDVHAKNFMTSPSKPGEQINIIDFDNTYIKFDKEAEKNIGYMFSNYIKMINKLNEILNIPTSLVEMPFVYTFKAIEEELVNMQKKLIRYYK